MILILLILISSVFASNKQEYLNPLKININGEYYPLVGLNEPCIVDNSTYTLPRERGIGSNNCESGLTCFEFHCVYPSRENQYCDSQYFNNVKGADKNAVFDRSNCTSEFYCDSLSQQCKKTKNINDSCERPEQCISINNPNSTCYNKRCTLNSMVPHQSGNRYILVFFLLTVLMYIYYRQYTIQEAQLIRLNELAAQNEFEERRDPEIETLPPYSPPSSTFLAEAENDDDRCNRTHSLISPPSYHQFPPVNITPPMTVINTSVLNDNNSGSVNTINVSTASNTNNTVTNSIYPSYVNNSNDPNRGTNDSNSNYLSVNPRLSFISTQSSLVPNTPPPSYSQTNSPYLFNLDDENGRNDNIMDENALLPPSSANSNVIQPPIAHSRTNSRTLNLNNNGSTHPENRYSTLSNPEDRSYINRPGHRISTLSLRRRSSLRHSLSFSPSNSNANSSTENSPT